MPQACAKAKRILESLKGKKEIVASNLLDERIALCEHAYALATSSIQVMPLQTLRAHLAKSTALWAKFPYVLQIKVWQRHAVEDFLLACGGGEGKDKDGSSSSTAKKKSNTKVGSKESMSSLEAFFGALKWEQKADASFNGEAPQFSDTLAFMMHDLEESVYSLEASFDAQLLALDAAGDEASASAVPENETQKTVATAAEACWQGRVGLRLKA